MADNLLVADMRKAIRETFGDFITTVDKEFKMQEAADAEFTAAKERLREQFKRLYTGVERLRDCQSKERAESIRDRMVSIAGGEVANAFAALIQSFMNGVLNYCDFP